MGDGDPFYLQCMSSLGLIALPPIATPLHYFSLHCALQFRAMLPEGALIRAVDFIAAGAVSTGFWGLPFSLYPWPSSYVHLVGSICIRVSLVGGARQGSVSSPWSHTPSNTAPYRGSTSLFLHSTIIFKDYNYGNENKPGVAPIRDESKTLVFWESPGCRVKWVRLGGRAQISMRVAGVCACKRIIFSPFSVCERAGAQSIHPALSAKCDPLILQHL